MNKEEFTDVVLKKLDEKKDTHKRYINKFRKIGGVNFLRIASEAKGFNDGVGWILEKVQEVVDS